MTDVVVNVRALNDASGQDAAAASDSATLSQAWAEGTEPGGPGTKSAQEHSEDAAGSETAAATSAAQAALYDGPKVDTFAELASVTPAMLAVGEHIRCISGGWVYQREPEVVANSHLDYTGAGGVKLKVLPGADGRYDWVAFGADPTGTVSSTVAATNAELAGPTFIPKGSFLVSNLPIREGGDTKGAGRKQTYIVVEADDAAAWAHTDSTSVGVSEGPRWSDFTVMVAPGVKRAKGWSKKTGAHYLAYPRWENIETRLELEITYEAFLIYAKMIDCRDGYEGTPVAGQTHQVLVTDSGLPGYTNSTNLNYFARCVFMRSSSPEAIRIRHGDVWTFDSCSFENNNNTASLFRATGVNQVTFNECYWENNAGAHVLVTETNVDAPKGSRGLVVNGGYLDCHTDMTHFAYTYSGTTYAIDNLMSIGVVEGMRLSGGPSNNFVSAFGNTITGGYSSVYFDRKPKISGLILGAGLEIESGAIVKDSGLIGASVLPIGPANLYVANFTAGTTGTPTPNLTDVISLVGSRNAVRMRSSDSHSWCYYDLPPLLIEAVKGKRVTVLITLTAPATTAVSVITRLWADVSPDGVNHVVPVDSAGASLNAGAARCAYAVVDVPASPTSLRVGWYTGGAAAGSLFNIEAIKMIVGDVRVNVPFFS